MATLRNTALNVMKLHGATNIAATQREFSYRPDTVMAVIVAA